ncbi:MAG: TonB-dependent receptor [Gemmatimonadetes bacterium]|jgi:iron complex outermembrane recepter protein|nr:TonB-dependent receptor [Gemmatimonadota bacterium]MBT5145483.1 TonB-dependent receptor [Gemmatimonadota bacterium]MBT5591671.1 TonB-dependent receptor [Gemmatimonadota bacterium]MBT5961874.1 TonB-dependent receptor [Gemmatimonadota bacterium]MBT6626460.1 TonB-dependent receptor [Gemmatimonadota bacterium]
MTQRGLVLTAILLLTHCVSEAKTGLADLSLDELMDLEVTLVSRRPQRVTETPAALAIITGDELRRLGVKSLPDALRLAPGFQVGQVDANKWVVASRGFAGLFANKLLVLVDGRSVYTPLFSGVFWESQGVLMEDVERLEIIRGPGGSMWGANAVNGIVNVVTREAATTPETFVHVGAGSERRQLAVRHGRPIPGGGLRIDAERIDIGRSAAAGDKPVRDDWQMQRVGLRADVDRGASDHLTVLGNVRGGSVGQSVTFVMQALPAVASTKYSDADLLSYDVLGRWRHHWNDDHEFEAQVYYDLFDRDEAVLHGRIHNADIDLQHRFRTGAHRLVWGTGYRRTWDDFDGTFTMQLDPASRTTHLFSGFVHDDIELIPQKLALSAGTKLEHNSFSNWEWQPSVHLWGAPSEDVSVWVGMSRAVRTPSRGDHDFNAAIGVVPADSLFSGAPEAVVTLLGSDRVEAEDLFAIDAGLRTQLGSGGFLDAALFYYKYDDLTTQEPGFPYTIDEPGPPHLIAPVRGDNLASGTALGIELVAEWEMSPSWQIRGSYTYLHLDVDVDLQSVTPDSNPYENDSPTHQVGLRSLGRRGPWSLAFSGRWVAELPGPLPNIPDYLTADVRISRHFAQGLEVAISGRNLLQASHREAISNTVGAVPTRVQREFFVSASWRR